MTSPIGLLSGAIDLLIIWSQIWSPKPISRKELRKMNASQLKEAYHENFSRAVLRYRNRKLITASEASFAEEMCVCFFEEMSRRAGGAHGAKFNRIFLRELKKELKAVAKDKR